MNVKGTSKSKGRRGNEEDICGTVGRVIIVWQKDQRCDDDQLLSGKWSRNDKQQGECYCMRTNDEYWSSVVLTSSHCTLPRRREIKYQHCRHEPQFVPRVTRPLQNACETKS